MSVGWALFFQGYIHIERRIDLVQGAFHLVVKGRTLGILERRDIKSLEIERSKPVLSFIRATSVIRAFSLRPSASRGLRSYGVCASNITNASKIRS